MLRILSLIFYLYYFPLNINCELNQFDRKFRKNNLDLINLVVFRQGRFIFIVPRIFRGFAFCWLFTGNKVSAAEMLFLFAVRKYDERDSYKIHCVCADAVIRGAGSAFWCMHSARTIAATRRSHVCCKNELGSTKNDIETNNKKKGSGKRGVSEADSRAAVDARFRINDRSRFMPFFPV